MSDKDYLKEIMWERFKDSTLEACDREIENIKQDVRDEIILAERRGEMAVDIMYEIKGMLIAAGK